MSKFTLVIVALILLIGCADNSSVVAGESGVEGVVLVGPTCPVESLESPCPDRPIEAEVSVVRAGSDDVVRVAHSGSDGRFRTSVQPGEYTLSASASGAMSCKPENVTVEAGQFTEVTILCDTGIR